MRDITEEARILPCLVNLSRGKIHTLSDKDFVIGRSTSCDVQIKDATVSRRHATISIIDGQYYIRDMGSRNGTILNSEKVGQNLIRLKPDDQLTIGKTVYLFSPVGVSEAIYGSPNRKLDLGNRIALSCCAMVRLVQSKLRTIADAVFGKGRFEPVKSPAKH